MKFKFTNKKHVFVQTDKDKIEIFNHSKEDYWVDETEFRGNFSRKQLQITFNAEIIEAIAEDDFCPQRLLGMFCISFCEQTEAPPSDRSYLFPTPPGSTPPQPSGSDCPETHRRPDPPYPGTDIPARCRARCPSHGCTRRWAYSSGLSLP